MGWRPDQGFDAADIAQRLYTGMSAMQMCVLGTTGSGGLPHLTPCFFAPLKDLRIVFVSSARSRHVTNLTANPNCSAAITDTTQSPRDQLRSISLSGAVIRPSGASRIKAFGVFAARFASGAAGTLKRSFGELREKEIFVLESEVIELFDTGFHPGAVRMYRELRPSSAD